MASTSSNKYPNPKSSFEGSRFEGSWFCDKLSEKARTELEVGKTFEVNKRSAGVFLTEGDPFDYDVFAVWIERALGDATASLEICEPYAGKNGLLFHLTNRYGDIIEGRDISYTSFDIEHPEENLFPASPVIRHNTLMDLPDDYDIIISNPPYLARNSARRRGLDFPFNYEGKGIAAPHDLYQIALDTCLAHGKWICFLIPESFITSKYDKSRLSAVISLPGGLFTDTDCPVCLALFDPRPTGDFSIYNQDGCNLGTLTQLEKKSSDLLGEPDIGRIAFNIPDGILGLRGVDNTKSESIRFVPGSEIPSEKIKNSSRSITRLSVDGLSQEQLAQLIVKSNELLGKWRAATNDVFLTAFKGIRQDGRDRRRLSFDIAAKIVARSLEELSPD